MSGFEWMYGADEPANNESGGTRSGRGARAADVPTDQPSVEPGGGRRAARPQSEFVSPPPPGPGPGSSGGGRRAARPVRQETTRPEPPVVDPLRAAPVRREPTRAERYQAMGRGSTGSSPTPAPQEWNDPDVTAVAPLVRETPRPARHVPPPPAAAPSVEETAVAPAPEWYRQDPQPAPPAAKIPDQQLAPSAAREFDWNDPAAVTAPPRPAERPRARTTSRDELHEARHEAYPPAGRHGAAYASGYDDEPYDDYPPEGGYDEPYAPYPGEERDRPRISVWQVLSSTLLVLALLVGLFTVYTYRSLTGNIDTVSLGEKAADIGPKEPINILVMGSDSRDCKGCGVDGASGGGSDTNILLHLSANRKFAYGVSIPRDTMVDRPSCKTKDGKTAPADYVRWNAAYSAGGPTCTVTQLESVASDLCGEKCDITVNHLVVVDFASFKGMVDAIDGVDVCLPQEVDDKYTGAHFDAGKQTLTGKQALNYVRLRHGLGDGGDLDRSKRQQAFIGSMAAKLLSGDTLSSPTKVLGFLNAATKGLTMDEGLKDNLDTMAKIGSGFQSIGMENIKFLTIPTLPDPENPEATVVLDEEKARNVFKAIANDKPLTKKIAAGALDAGQAAGKKSKGSGDAASDSGPTDGATDGETAGSTSTDEADSGESADTGSDGASSGASEEELAQIAEEAKAARERAGLC
ncbi:LCP family glycopolymer transferase [Nocardioides luteus]|uniref:LCP family glycopolymer transferase n=1 Tax=Nocardioides luteus TaxID=1844 RepID=UPI001C4366C3|nr:LCP family protein [Nocardioides luteus]